MMMQNETLFSNIYLLAWMLDSAYNSNGHISSLLVIGARQQGPTVLKVISNHFLRA